MGCGPEFEASFSPLSEAGAPADDGNATTTGNAAGQNNTAGSIAGTSSMGGSVTVTVGDASGSAGASNTAGQGGACARPCAALEPWVERSYALGERVTSICKAPYNGACAANTQHEFECQPPTGVVGLGWCSVRQPGVGNGWHEAWRISAICE